MVFINYLIYYTTYISTLNIRVQEKSEKEVKNILEFHQRYLRSILHI